MEFLALAGNDRLKEQLSQQESGAAWPTPTLFQVQPAPPAYFGPAAGRRYGMHVR